jgi:NAD(P)-dependent dehydrogenase (short-subunit alcohol dehydrogenase family)
MDLKIEGKTALVTGGCNGIGKSISLALANEGVNLTLTTRNKSKVKNFIKELTEFDIKVKIIELDFLKNNWFKKFKRSIAKDKFDILVNNAGHTLNITNPYCDIEDWNKIIELNFLAPVQISNLVIPKMKKNNWGRIVNITSVAGLENSGPVTYCVSKAQLTAYSRVMGRILATENQNIVMTAVFPGVIATKGGHWEKMKKKNPSHVKRYLASRTPLKRFGSEKEVADAVLFHCSELASFSHGAIIAVDGGQSKNYMPYSYID